MLFFECQGFKINLDNIDCMWYDDCKNITKIYYGYYHIELKGDVTHEIKAYLEYAKKPKKEY